MRLATLLLLAFAAPARADAPAWDRAVFDRLDWGIVCAAESGRREAAPDTMSGFIDIYEGEAVIGRRTTLVPAIPELAFGVVAWAAPGGIDGVTITVTHPPMQPAGTVRQSWTASFADGVSAANFFRFDLPEERVPGPWRMVATAADGRVLYDIGFEVVDPALLPGFSDPCPGPPQIS